MAEISSHVPHEVLEGMYPNYRDGLWDLLVDELLPETDDWSPEELWARVRDETESGRHTGLPTTPSEFMAALDELEVIGAVKTTRRRTVLIVPAQDA